jgi:hypothetical protein
MLLPLPPRNLTKARVDFNVDDFATLIAQKGLNLRWQQAAQCPCSSKTDDLNLDLDFVGANLPDQSFDTQYNSGCPICDGKGVIYHSAQDIQGVVASAAGDYLNARFGGYHDGVINISLNPEHLPSFGDKFEILDSVMLYSEAVEDNGLNTLSLRFPIVERTMTLATGNVTVGVIYGTYADAITRVTQAVELTQGVDFRVTNGEIEWINKPANAGKFAFSYYAHPTYTCVAFPNSVRDTHIRKKSPVEKNAPMPVRVQCKLEFLGES